MEAPPRLELGVKLLQSSALPLGYGANNRWSGRRDSNSRPSPWQGDALPLSHVRTFIACHKMAGDLGFEPRHDGVKVRCLTAWLIPNGIWGDRGELNPRVSDPQTDALTTSPRSPYEIICLAGAAGIEPTLTVLETAVLPLNYAPKKWWRLMDSNHRTRQRTDLQSAAFGHFAKPP
jgi:hypothetical protein